MKLLQCSFCSFLSTYYIKWWVLQYKFIAIYIADLTPSYLSKQKEMRI